MQRRALELVYHICLGRITEYGEGFTSQNYDSAEDKNKLENPRDDNFEVINIDDNEGLFTEITNKSEGQLFIKRHIFKFTILTSLVNRFFYSRFSRTDPEGFKHIF